MTQKNLKWGLLTAALALVLTFGISACGSDDPVAEDNGPADAVSTDDDTQADVDAPMSTTAGEWQVVTLANQGMIFGKSSDLTDGTFLVVDDAFFVENSASEDSTEADETDPNMLARFGGEIHRPYPRVMIPWAAVVFVQPLADDSTALAAITDFEVQSPEPTVPTGMFPEGSTQVVFAVTGDVFFGAVQIDGAALRMPDAYLLAFADEDATDLSQIETLDDMSLVPAMDPSVGSVNELLIPLDKILTIQTLAENSPVVEALAAQ